MKIDRHGRAKILTQSEIQLLFSAGLESPRDRALFGIRLYTACRIAEACSMLTLDVYNAAGVVRPELIIRKRNTKGKLATRTIPVLDDLRSRLNTYRPLAGSHFLFPGRYGRGHIHPDTAARFFKEACERVGIEGAST